MLVRETDGYPPTRYEILGPLRARRGDLELELGPGKQRAVLAVLLLNANKPTSVTHIVDAVWGDEPPENGANVVQKYVAGLRRALEPDRTPRESGQVITRTPAGYLLTVGPDCLDAEVFERDIREAQAIRDDGDPVGAAAMLLQTCGQWRATALMGFTGPLFDAARTRLDESRAAALETWAELELTHGDRAQAVPRLVRLVADYPLRERLRCLLIMALYRSGRRAEALAVFREARRFFIEQFGVEPGERLQELHRQVLRSDPLLDGSPPAAAQPAPGPVPEPGPPPSAAPVFAAAAAVTMPAGYPPPQGYPAPDTALRWWQVLGRVLVVLVPVVSFGFCTWLVLAGYAIVRRRVVHGLAAGGYLGLVFLAMLLESHRGDAWDALGVVAFLICIFGGALHVGLLAWHYRTPARTVEQRVRRELAREIFRHSPSIARQLHIGRPDLPPVLDDGGLLDINAVPAHLIASLPGIGAQQAWRIVHDRQLRGAFASVEDLVARRLVAPAIARDLAEILLFVPYHEPGHPAATVPSGAAVPPPQDVAAASAVGGSSVA